MILVFKIRSLEDNQQRAVDGTSALRFSFLKSQKIFYFESNYRKYQSMKQKRSAFNISKNPAF